MRRKLSQLLVFVCVTLTLIVGITGTYLVFFQEQPVSKHLTVLPAGSFPSGSLLEKTPYSLEATRGAENRVRTRSPAFQTESTKLEDKKSLR